MAINALDRIAYQSLITVIQDYTKRRYHHFETCPVCLNPDPMSFTGCEQYDSIEETLSDLYKDFDALCYSNESTPLTVRRALGEHI